MLFSDLFTYALMPDRTADAENGRAFSYARSSGETVLLFKSDCPALSRSHFTGRKCDRILYYKREGCEICVLIEFKGRDIQHGYEQIIETYQIMRSKKVFSNAKFLGLVLSAGGSSPRRRARIAIPSGISISDRTVGRSSPFDMNAFIAQNCR